MTRPKVFQIGFNKCGTTSLHQFFQRSGLRSVHWDGGYLAPRMEDNIRAGRRAIAGYEEDVLEAEFGGMLRALQYGAPPHGGIAPGIDRIVMLLCGTDNIREVTMFPMNQQAEDLLMGAPSEVSPEQLKDLNIRLSLPKT